MNSSLQHSFAEPLGDFLQPSRARTSLFYSSVGRGWSKDSTGKSLIKKQTNKTCHLHWKNAEKCSSAIPQLVLESSPSVETTNQKPSSSDHYYRHHHRSSGRLVSMTSPRHAGETLRQVPVPGVRRNLNDGVSGYRQFENHGKRILQA